MAKQQVSAANRTIPNDSKHDVVTFDLLIEGQPVAMTIQIMTIVVTKEANRIPTAKIMIRDGSPAEETFEASEMETFIPGKKIEIKAGRDGHNEVIFKGVIVKHSLKAHQNAAPYLFIECKDESLKLTLGRKDRYFEEMKDSEAITEVLAGLAGDVEETKVKRREIVQYYSTDWDFILSRADMNGLLVFASDGKVNLKAPDTSSEPVLTLVYGSNLREFETEMDAYSQWKNVEAKAWDYAGQALFEASSNASGKFTEHGNLTGAELAKAFGPDKLELRHSGFLKSEELKAWADAAMLRSRLAKIRGRAKIIGFSGVMPGICVNLQGMGERFNGKAYVTAVRHQIGEGAWYTDIQFGLSAEWFYQKPDVQAPAAAGLLPGIQGLQIGKVIQLEKDPDGEDRIQVKLPLIDNAGKGIWSRVATLDAGKERGTFFRPEIDDEVIVGFINGDPRDAIILGMLHSSAKPAPVSAKDDNHIKGYVSRSKMKVMFDDEKKILTIETPAGNKLIISEEDKAITTTDQNGNETKLSPDGISMTSPKDIKIEAKGKISITATQDLSMEGLNVTAKAQVNFKAEGAAGAEISTSAIAKVKGSMVMIN